MDDLPLPTHVIEQIERRWAAKVAKPASLKRGKGQANNAPAWSPSGPMSDAACLLGRPPTRVCVKRSGAFPQQPFRDRVIRSRKRFAANVGTVLRGLMRSRRFLHLVRLLLSGRGNRVIGAAANVATIGVHVVCHLYTPVSVRVRPFPLFQVGLRRVREAGIGGVLRILLPGFIRLRKGRPIGLFA